MEVFFNAANVKLFFLLLGVLSCQVYVKTDSCTKDLELI